MTNEECWHVGGCNAHLGPDHPNSLAGGHLISIRTADGGVEMRSEPDDATFAADWSAVTDISVKAMLDAAAAVCAAPAGAVMPDLRPALRDVEPLGFSDVIGVSVVGAAAVSKVVTAEIEKKSGLVLAEVTTSDVVVHVPDAAEIGDGTAQTTLEELLRAGVDVVTPTLPTDPDAADRAATEGGASLLVTGGPAAAVSTSVLRSFAGIFRDLERADLVVHPSAGAVEPTSAELDLARDLLGEAMLPGPDPAVSLTWSRADDAPADTLRYHLTTSTGGAVGRARFTFRNDVFDPAEAVTARILVGAIAVVLHAAPPGRHHLDLGIERVLPDERLARVSQP